MGDKSGVETGMAVAKDGIAILRDLAIGSIVVLLLLWPSTVHEKLRKAGISKILGIEIETKILENANALSALQGEMIAIKTDWGEAKKRLLDVSKKISDAPLAEVIGKNVELIDKRLGQAATAIASAEEAQKASRSIVEEAEKSLAGGAGGWAVVFGGDRDLEGARYEVETRARNIAGRKAIYKKDGMYRSIALFDSRAEAQRALPDYRKLNSGAYTVATATWCRTAISKSGYSECG